MQFISIRYYIIKQIESRSPPFFGETLSIEQSEDSNGR